MTFICKKCNGKGSYAYDSNHSKVCDGCCPHDMGWWELTEHYSGYAKGLDNRCCIRGCGTLHRELKND